MKQFILLISLATVIGGQVSAQAVDFAGSYYHFSLARMHELREEYQEAISEFEQAIELGSESASCRF